MKRPTAWNRVVVVTSTLCLAVLPSLRAQTAAAPAATNQTDDTVVLSPFIVDARSDENGYRANSTLAGTRVRTDLKDVASAISVVTQQFLQDTGAKNNSDLLVYTPSTEVAGIRGNFSGVAGSGIYQENTISSSTRVRGLDSADNTRDYFLTDIPWDGFNVGRVDLQRGPNSILFGTGSPAGIINTSVNPAAFKTSHNYENVVDQYGSIRNSLDLNQVLIPKIASIRVAALNAQNRYEQKPAYNNTTRLYAALRFDPMLFSSDNHTSIRANYEDGKVDSNNPRSIPPNDDLSLWFKTGQDPYGHYNYNKIIFNQFSYAQPTPWGTTLPGGKGGNFISSFEPAQQGRSYWPDLINYYEQTPPSRNGVANSPVPSGTSLLAIAAQPNIGLSLHNAGGGLTAGSVNSQFLPVGIPEASAYYASLGNQNYNVPGGSTPYPGGVYYRNVVIQDPSVFNFYKLLGDGPNKHEWQKWKAFNAVIDQSFLSDRVSFQVAFDHQDYLSGSDAWMTGENYSINVDLNATYANGATNPNAGRPYFANGASAPGLNYQNRTVRDSVRLTPTVELRSEDFIHNERLAKILGKSIFTGVFDHSTVKQEYMNWAEYATSPDYPQSGSTDPAAANTLNSNRSFEWVAYIGPNLQGASSPAGAHLGNITSKIAPPTSQYVNVFDSHWNKPTNPNDPNYVNPNDPFTYRSYNDGTIQNTKQYDNGANYVGWTTQNVNWMRDSNPADFPSLVEAANRNRYRDISQGFTWQGYFLGGSLVPTLGWRKDVITNYQTNSPKNANSGFVSMDYNDDFSSRTDVRGESKTWGGVYHLDFLNKFLPWDSTVSVFYDRSSNFKADASRLDLAGNPIPNATGQTKEYGVTISTLHDKLLLKVDWFHTKVSNATLSGTDGNSIGGLGVNGYVIANNSEWGWAWATDLQEGNAGRISSNIWDYASADGLPKNTPDQIAAYKNYNMNGGTFTDANGTTHTFAGATAVVNAWLKAPFPSTFFSSYNQTPLINPTLAYKSGNLIDAYVGGLTAGYSNIPQGGGSSFGNHQTTVDTLSSGTEMELTYQPVKNWNITLNYSRQSATRENIDPVSQHFISTMTAFMNGPGGQVREWYNGGTTVGTTWNSAIVAPYAVLVNQLGHQAPEVAPWRLNLVSTYNFDHTILKGVFFGGGLRSEAGRIVGYKYDPTYVNAISADPNYAAVKSLTLGGLNVNQPFKGSPDTHLDVWLGYNRKITRDINWRVQLNIQSFGEKDHLVTAGVNPDGSVALVRIAQGMGFRLTNSFDF
jgi:hypothetical protein